MGVPLDTYRRLYKLRKEEPIPPFPKPQKWWHVPREWAKCVWHLPPKKKLSLSRKGVVSIIQNGAILTIAIALGQYLLEAPKRVKQSHYQAWQMINSATGQKTSGGRIEALQDLVKDGVSLQGLDVSGAYLEGIKLQNASLLGADLSGANLEDANFSEANLLPLVGWGTYVRTNFKGAKNITSDQIKKARSWQSACYDPDFRIKLGLPPENAQNTKRCAGNKTPIK